MNVCFIKDTIHSIHSTNKSSICENKFRYTSTRRGIRAYRHDGGVDGPPPGPPGGEGEVAVVAAGPGPPAPARVQEAAAEVVREEGVEHGVDGGVGVLEAAGGQGCRHEALLGHRAGGSEHQQQLRGPVRGPAQEVDCGQEICVDIM